MSARECLTAAEVENKRVRINQLYSILRFNVNDALGIPPELCKDQEEKTEKESGNQQRVIRCEFEVGVH